MITKLNLDGSDRPLDVPAGEADAQGAGASLYSSIAAQILVGRYVVHVGQPFGGVVEEAAQTASPSRARATPILQRPGLPRGLLGREQELSDALSAVDAGLSIEVSGERGVGKTAFLHQLAHHSGAAAFVDGVVYISGRNQSSADILQLIFEAFFESHQVAKPTHAEIRRGLEDKQALILLDDVQLARNEMEQLLDVAPRSALALATRERCLLGEVRSVVLHGLAATEAVMLLEREVGRPLSASERSIAADVCGSVEGHPVRIRQVAALLRDRGIAIDVLARDVLPDKLITELMTSIDEKQRRVLATLAIVSLPVPHIAGLAEVIDVEPSLAALVRQGLVVRSQSRHRLADGVADQLRRTEHLKPWVNRAITYFTAWAERYRRTPNALLEESDALLRVQYCAVETQRWGEVLHLGRLIEGALIAGARWGAWAVTLDRCLTAAKAMKDRSAEAWALHEIGTRALCLGDAGIARTSLSRALKLRETLDDDDAIAASRRNLSFVMAPIPIASRRPLSAPAVTPAVPPAAAAVRDFDSLPLREAVPVPVVVASKKRSVAPLLVVLLFIVLGGLGYLASGSWLSWANLDVSGSRPVLQSGLAVPATDIEIPPEPVRSAPAPARVLRFTAFPDVITAGESLGLCYEVAHGAGVRIDPDIGEVDPLQRNCVRAAPSETTTYTLTARTTGGDSVRQTVLVRVGLNGSTPREPATERASILIFSPRPGSIAIGGSTALCYAISGGLHARIEPGVGDVKAASVLTCMRVTPSRTTTYELIASGSDGYQVKRQLVIVAR